MTNMTEQEIRKIIPEPVWVKVDGQLARHGHEEYQAIYYRFGLEEMYYRIVHPAEDPTGYYITTVAKNTRDPFDPSWLISVTHSLEDAKRIVSEHREKAIHQMLREMSDSDQPEKPEEDAQPINLRELLDEECDRLADEYNRGEWKTLSSEMKYLKQKQYDTLLTYLTLLDQIAECEDKNA